MSESKLEEYKSYHNNGKLRCHYCFKDGKLYGECKRWYDNGHIQQYMFHIDGERYGEYKYWYPNGQLWIYSYYNNGKFHGEHKQYSNKKNGQLREHVFYNNGKFHGERKIYYNNGKVGVIMFYKDGKELDKYTWDCLIKVQRAYRIKHNLKKYFKSKAFVEWWYHPDMPGGKAAKKDLESFVKSL